jgi:hypothetical protein
VFPLLCPVREYEWIDTWRCRLIFTQSGVAEQDAIFTTEAPSEIWTVCRYAPPEIIEFVRVSPGLRVNRMTLELRAEDMAGTVLRWTSRFTSLSEAGNRWLEDMDRAAFDRQMDLTEARLNHFLDTGHILKTQ